MTKSKKTTNNFSKRFAKFYKFLGPLVVIISGAIIWHTKKPISAEQKAIIILSVLICIIIYAAIADRVIEFAKSLFFLLRNIRRFSVEFKRVKNGLTNYREMFQKFEGDYLDAKRKAEIFKTRKRVVILLPLSTSVDQPNEHFGIEVKSCIKGVYKALRTHIGLVDSIDIAFADHKNNPLVAIDIIKKEFDKGCEHFICTMSAVCSVLASTDKESLSHFNKIVEEYNNTRISLGKQTIDPILICTCAASSKIDPECTNVYRIFKNAEIETEEIVIELEKLHIIPNDRDPEYEIKVKDIKACAIYSSVNSHMYSREAGEKFIELMKERGIVCKSVIVSEYDQLSKILSEKKHVIRESNLIYLFTYFDLNEEVIRRFTANDELISHKCNLITPTIFPRTYFLDNHIKEEKNFIRNAVLNKEVISWYISRPIKRDKETGKPKLFIGEFSEFCMNISMQKLLTIISRPDYKSSPGNITSIKFEKLWSDPELSKKIHPCFSFNYTEYKHDPVINIELSKLDSSNASISS